MSSRDTKIKRTLLESGLGLLVKYTRKTRITDTRVHDNMVPWALRALGTKTIVKVHYPDFEPTVRLEHALWVSTVLSVF